MRARVERDWSSLMIRIWFYEPSEGGGRVLRVLSDDTYRWEDVTPGTALAAPSIVLPEDALQELVREVSNILPVEDATSAHLKDAIGVRDRLLALVEKHK